MIESVLPRSSLRFMSESSVPTMRLGTSSLNISPYGADGHAAAFWSCRYEVSGAWPEFDIATIW